MVSLSLAVQQQFPGYVRESYPVFVEFIKTYYKWVNEQQSIGRLQDALDIDTTPERFVQHFRNQLDVYGMFERPYPVGSFNSKYLKSIRDIYAAKGSEDGLVAVLRMVSGASDIQIVYPSTQILRASDGKWQQDNFITVRVVSGEIPSTIKSFYAVFANALKRVEVSRYERVDVATIRLYFKAVVSSNFIINQDIQFRDSQGVVTCVCRVELSPKNITVINGGKDWQPGQVIRFPGTQVDDVYPSRDTLARVARVDANGAITQLEILQYGYTHPVGVSQLIVSPYTNKPPSTSFNIEQELTGTSPITYTYTLTLNTLTEGMADAVYGVSVGVDRYFFENYVDTSYNGTLAFNNVVTVTPPATEYPSDLTLEEWLDSRAILTFEHDVVIKTKGHWLDEAGQISNQSIRLQDSFYYQQFSYVIETDVNPSQYTGVVGVIHPAGMKRFASYVTTTEIELTLEADTDFPFTTQFTSDVAELFETNTKDVIKPIIDNTSFVDVVTNATAKYLIDTTSLSSPDINETEVSFFTAEDYFAENYNSATISLTLGA